MKEKLKFEVGTYLLIPLSDGSFGYGRVLKNPYIAFYNYQTDRPTSDLDLIDLHPILFKQAVRFHKENKWINIGINPLNEELAKPVVRFMQDLADFRKCIIFDSEGLEQHVSPEDCIGVERAEVWESYHLEQRLLDTFQGKQNAAELYSRVRLK
ncbi:MAG: Imm26 family immunity protein [bacterium]|nr:Imm26 family immunity protein [bacterium]